MIYKTIYWCILFGAIYQLFLYKGDPDVDYFQLCCLLALVFSLDKLVNEYFKEDINE